MLKKKKYPILEFDDNKKAFINPSDVLEKYGVHEFPSKLIICFFREVMDSLIQKNEVIPIITIQGENPDTFYKFKDKDIAITQGLIGAPACVGLLEEGIGLGAKKIILCGGCGSLEKNVTLGKIIVVNGAIRDEGTSFHYMKPSVDVMADFGIVKTLSDYFENNHIDYVVGKTWTTDAFYRETKDRIERRKKQGAIIVEMEQAAMFAVARFRGVQYGAIIYGGDDLSGEKWDPRKWRNRVDIRAKLVAFSRDLVELI